MPIDIPPVGSPGQVVTPPEQQSGIYGVRLQPPPYVPDILGHLAFMHTVLSEFDAADCHGELFWHTGASQFSISFFVNCNDVFHWATADAEPITPDDLEALCTAFGDAARAGDISYGPELYCARRRKMRPQGAFYPRRTGAGRAHAANEQMWALFDACGPERPIGVGNPVETPSAPERTTP